VQAGAPHLEQKRVPASNCCPQLGQHELFAGLTGYAIEGVGLASAAFPMAGGGGVDIPLNGGGTFTAGARGASSVCESLSQLAMPSRHTGVLPVTCPACISSAMVSCSTGPSCLSPFMKYQFICITFTSANSIRDVLFSGRYHQKATGLNVVALLNYYRSRAPSGQKKGRGLQSVPQRGYRQAPSRNTRAGGAPERRTSGHLASAMKNWRFLSEA
jgi:hypothetical protein